MDGNMHCLYKPKHIVDIPSLDPCEVTKVTYKEASVRCKEIDSTSSVDLSQKAEKQLVGYLEQPS